MKRPSPLSPVRLNVASVARYRRFDSASIRDRILTKKPSSAAVGEQQDMRRGPR
jgi:hypothetical protein